MKDYTITIETQRLILRKFEMSDADDMFNNYTSHDEVTKYLSWDTYKSVDDAISYIKNIALPKYNQENSYKWAIVLKETNQVVGSIDCVHVYTERKCAEIGYVLGDDYWGKGMMPEAAEAVIEYLFNEGFERIEAVHDVENPKSGRVMQKVGMTFEGTLKKGRMRKDGTFIDCHLYAIVKP